MALRDEATQGDKRTNETDERHRAWGYEKTNPEALLTHIVRAQGITGLGERKV